MFSSKPLFHQLLLPALLVSALMSADASPLARYHMKFEQPPHVQEHGIVTDGDRIISQRSYLSIGRRIGAPLNGIRRVVAPLPHQGAGAYYSRSYPSQSYPQPRYDEPQRTSATEDEYPPVEQTIISERERSHPTPDFSNGLAYPDPLLLTGDAAMLAVKYIYGRGELFFHDVPHERDVLRNQHERIENGLHGNVLRSIRPGNPFYQGE